jgi:ABC-type lipoprotein export system ATPase subunit
MGETLKKNISLMADYRLKNIGIVTQDCQLLENRTCYENIAFPLRCLKLDHKNIIKRVEEVMEILDVSQYRNEYPYKLSGGQCQRIAIARAAVKTPKVFIADEPTGALDLKAEQEVLKALKTIISKECTVIIATHSDGVAKWCDRSVVIKDFKID